MLKGNYYNLADRFAVAVMKGGTVVGHIPRNVCSIFIRKGGSIFCLTTGSRRFSSDLPQGGLEFLYSRSSTTAWFAFLMVAKLIESAKGPLGLGKLTEGFK